MVFALCGGDERAVRLAALGLAVAPPLVLFGPDGRESSEARRIYHMEG